MKIYYVHKKLIKKHYPELIKKLRFNNFILLLDEQLLLYKNTHYKGCYNFHFRNDDFHDRLFNIMRVSNNKDNKTLNLIRFISKNNISND